MRPSPIAPRPFGALLGSLLGAAAFGAALVIGAASARADDASLTCDQIASEVAAQNAIISTQGQAIADLKSKPADPGDVDPAILERKAQIKSDRATARANTLVALGRTKHCFK